MFTVRYKYIFLTVLLFIIEIGIALFVHDKIIRPYAGDFLVVILIYVFFKSFLDVSTYALALSVLLFAYVIEILQYFNFISLLGLQHSMLARLIFGNSFQWLDIVAYTLGIAVVIVAENHGNRQR